MGKFGVGYRQCRVHLFMLSPGFGARRKSTGDVGTVVFFPFEVGIWRCYCQYVYNRRVWFKRCSTEELRRVASCLHRSRDARDTYTCTLRRVAVSVVFLAVAFVVVVVLCATMDILHAQLAFIEHRLAFVVVEPLDWKTYVQAFSWAVTLFESYLMYVLANL